MKLLILEPDALTDIEFQLLHYRNIIDEILKSPPEKMRVAYIQFAYGVSYEQALEIEEYILQWIEKGKANA